MADQKILNEVKTALIEAIKSAAAAGALCVAEGTPAVNGVPESLTPDSITLEPPRDKAFGDIASNVAMKVSKAFSKKPVELAEIIVKHIRTGLFSKIEVKAPGFINFYLSQDTIYANAIALVKADREFGKIDLGHGAMVNVEFGSINPTGPISVSHGRQVVLGDIFSSMLEYTNHRVTREYYCNDTGNQIRNLGRSVLARYRQACGENIEFPEDGYHGEYVMELAREIISTAGDKHKTFVSAEDDERLIDEFGEFAQKKMIREILDDCGLLGVKYDKVYSERSLYTDGIVEKTLQFLREKGLTYEKDGATWFLSTKFGDEKDRVLIKSDGKNTYALSDIAYHKTKHDRGFVSMITFLGADHHGYTKRLHAAVESLGVPKDCLRILIHQFVTMLRDGQVVRMSKRAANFVVLSELVGEAGADATRYFFIMRKMDAHLEFDINLAKSQTTENPVYYLQYCHARCHGIINEAKSRGYDTDIKNLSSLPVETLQKLSSPEEMDILKKACEFPKVIEECVRNFAPHLICHYAEDFAKLFQSFYTKGKMDKNFRIVTDDAELTKARLFLMYVVLIVMRNTLGMLKISAPEKM